LFSVIVKGLNKVLLKFFDDKVAENFAMVLYLTIVKRFKQTIKEYKNEQRNNQCISGQYFPADQKVFIQRSRDFSS
jgi:hypothetical protein